MLSYIQSLLPFIQSLLPFIQPLLPFTRNEQNACVPFVNTSCAPHSGFKWPEYRCICRQSAARCSTTSFLKIAKSRYQLLTSVHYSLRTLVLGNSDSEQQDRHILLIIRKTLSAHHAINNACSLQSISSVI